MRFTAIFVTLVVAIAAPARAQDADDNDHFDLRAAIIPIGGLANTDTVTAQSLDPATDVGDVFRLRTASYDRLVAIVVPTEPARRPLAIALHDREGTLLEAGDGSAFDTVRFRLPEGGADLFFRVTLTDGAGPARYDLWIGLDRDDSYDAERSRIGAIWNRHVLTPGTPWSSRTGGLDGAHAYFDLLEPTSITAILEWANDPDMDCTADVDLDLHLDTELSGDRLAEDGRNEDFMPAAFSLPLQPGRYFLRAEPPGPADVPFSLRYVEEAMEVPAPIVAPGCAPIDGGLVDPIDRGADAGSGAPLTSTGSGGCSIGARHSRASGGLLAAFASIGLVARARRRQRRVAPRSSPDMVGG